MLNPKPYGLDLLVSDLRTLSARYPSEHELLQHVRPLAKRMAADPSWLRPEHYECDEQQGFGVHVLHEEADHTLAVFALAWLPGRGAPPHNHGTWAVIAGVDGAETNTYWKRMDDRTQPGHAVLRDCGSKKILPGQTCILTSDAIHSVTNTTERVTLSLHIYGKHLNFTGRSQFDPGAETEKPFILAMR
jgi:predicted metal-dependent enzyme (double-stranded beta helix superfamily)